MNIIVALHFHRMPTHICQVLVVAPSDVRSQARFRGRPLVHGAHCDYVCESHDELWQISPQLYPDFGCILVQLGWEHAQVAVHSQYWRDSDKWGLHVRLNLEGSCSVMLFDIEHSSLRTLISSLNSTEKQSLLLYAMPLSSI